jgi:hypothetical protein
MKVVLAASAIADLEGIGDRIDVLCILHGAQDYQPLLFPRE